MVDPGRTRSPLGDRITILGVVACAIGLAGSVYVVGWLVELVRFAAGGLPAGAATAALSTRELVGDGLRSILLMAAVFAAACALALFASARNWDVHGQDWHDIVRKCGVAKASDDAARSERARREQRHARRVTEQTDALPERLRRLAAPTVRLARLVHTTGGGDGGAEPGALVSAPLGDWAVRIVAGFNIMVLSALIAALVARGFAVAIPLPRLVAVLIGAGAFLLARWALTLASPLVLNARGHALVWVVVGVATLFAAAPVGVLVLTAIVVSTLGRRLARVRRPRSFVQFAQSPLPWVLLTICLLLGLAYNAMPPVSFPRVTLDAERRPLTGGYLTHSRAGVYVVTCTALADATSTDERLRLVPAADVEDVRIGGGASYLDSGRRPSIASLALRALGIDANVPTAFDLPLRATQPTCAGGGPSGLTRGAEDPALGAGVIVGPAPAQGRAQDGEAPIALTSPALAALALRYQPTLLVTVADRNWPVSVGAVLAERGPAGQPVCLVARRTLCRPTPASLAGASATPSDYLQLPIRLSRDPSPDGQFDAFLRGLYVDPGSLHHWLADPGVLDPWYSAQVYFYYAGPIDSSQWPAGARDPSVPSGLIGLEYWFYYPFNYYPLVVSADLMTDAPLAGDHVNVDLHQGDWEHVDVLLDPRTLRPVWLYMARHSYEGQFVPWTSPALTFDDGHVVLQAAFGGHPTYLPGCGGRPRVAAHSLSSDWLSCGSGRFAFRASTTPLVDIARTAWACWRGHFGEASRLEVDHARQPEGVIDIVKHFVFVAGPLSPLRQAENMQACRNGRPVARERPTVAAGARARG